MLFSVASPALSLRANGHKLMIPEFGECRHGWLCVIASNVPTNLKASLVEDVCSLQAGRT